MRPSSLTKKELKSDHSKPLSYCRLDYCRSPMFASRCSSDLKSQNKIPSQFRRTGMGKFLIKETRRITHNSIFADLTHSGFRTINSSSLNEITEPNCQRSIVLTASSQSTNRLPLKTDDRLKLYKPEEKNTSGIPKPQGRGMCMIVCPEIPSTLNLQLF